jgi:hypothetical protein
MRAMSIVLHEREMVQLAIEDEVVLQSNQRRHSFQWLTVEARVYTEVAGVL